MEHIWVFGVLAGALSGSIFLTWLGTAWLLDRHGQRALPDGTWDAIVVPGCAVWSGGRPSAALQRRTHHSVTLFQEGHAPRIIFTGGTGRHPPAEAEVAAEMARSLGVDDAAILIENRSTSTWENALFAANLEHEGGSIHEWRVLIATDGYHSWRCQRLFAQHFKSAHSVGSQSGSRARFRGALREVFSIMKMFLRRAS